MWDELPGSDMSFLTRSMADLRAALVARLASISLDEPRTARHTKQARVVLAMLRCNERAGGPQIADETGWPPHIRPLKTNRSVGR